MKFIYSSTYTYVKKYVQYSTIECATAVYIDLLSPTHNYMYFILQGHAIEIMRKGKLL